MAMMKRKPTRAGHRSGGLRSVWAYAALGCLLAVFLWGTGCDKADPPPIFAPPPPPVTPTWLFSIWGSGPNDIYIVGQPGIILHSTDGQTWTRQDSPTLAPLISVWGRGAGDVFACGHGGVILHNTGAGWVGMGSGTANHLYEVGSYQGGVYVGGANVELRRLAGNGWAPAGNVIARRSPDGTAVIDTLYRNEGDGSITTITHHGIAGEDGGVLMVDPVFDFQIRYVAAGLEWVLDGRSDEGALGGNYLVTDGGRLFQLREVEGRKSWIERSGLAPSRTAINGIWKDQGDTLYFATRDGQVIRRNPLGQMTRMYPPTGEFGTLLYDIWGTAPNDIYAVGVNANVIHYDGSGWAVVDVGLGKAKSGDLPILDKFGRPQE